MIDKPAILHTEASDGWGGQEIRILAEMKGMVRRGYRVMIAAPEHATIYGRSLEAGIETVALPMDKPSFFVSTLKLARLIKRERIGIINTHSSRDSWMGSIAGRLSGIPVIRSRHISSALGRNLLTRIVYNNLADAVITTGEFIKDQLVMELGLDPAKVYPISTGVDIDRFGKADGSNVRKSLGISPDAPVIGTAAVLRSWKGHKFLVHAMPQILKEVPEAKLVLAGEGPMRYLIEGWVREFGLEGSVFLLGHRDDVESVIAAFDVSVLASYASEGIPQFVLQSMAAGKPVIGAKTGGIPEVVTDGVTGIVVPPRDSEAIARAAAELLTDTDRARRMGEEAKRRVAANYTTDVMLDQVEALYARLLHA